MGLSHILLALGWIVFGVFHSLFAHENFKQTIGSHNKISPQTYRIAYNIFAFITLALLIWFQYVVVAVPLFRQHILVLISGWLIASGGLLIMLICVKKYFIQLSGIRYNSNKLQVTGIHRFVRHPLYAGTFLFIIGLLLIMPSLKNLIAVIIIIAYTIAGMKLEENKLLKIFGEEYSSYKRNVPALVPLIKKRRHIM